MRENADGESPGLSEAQYEQLVQFLVTWSGLSPQEAQDRLSGQLHPGQVTRSKKPPVQRPIYPPGTRQGKHPAQQ